MSPELAIGSLSALLKLDPDGTPPTKFRVFTSGMNTSLEGEFLFDEQAANDVVAAFKRHAVDGMIDLEHLSLDDKSPNYDPDARGAYGDLELVDGELWASNASWTPDGTRRLTERTQRYVSPTFAYDKKTRRVKRLFNIALTSNPSLDGIPALVAAKFNLAALGAEEGLAIMAAEDKSKAIADILKAVGMDPKMPAKVAGALGLDATATLEEISAAIAKFSAMVTKAEELLEGEPPGDTTATPDTAKTEPAAAAPTASPDATAAASAKSPNEKLLVAVESLVARNARQDAEAAEKAANEERASLVASRKWPTELLDWAGDKSTPIGEVKRLAAKFPFAEALSTAADAVAGAGATRGAGQHGLDDREIKICKDTGCTPENFAALKARRDAANKAV